MSEEKTASKIRYGYIGMWLALAPSLAAGLMLISVYTIPSFTGSDVYFALYVGFFIAAPIIAFFYSIKGIRRDKSKLYGIVGLLLSGPLVLRILALLIRQYL